MFCSFQSLSKALGRTHPELPPLLLEIRRVKQRASGQIGESDFRCPPKVSFKKKKKKKKLLHLLAGLWAP